MDNEDVDTAAAIRNMEMTGEPPELGKVGPINTTDMYVFDLEKPGMTGLNCIFMKTGFAVQF